MLGPRSLLGVGMLGPKGGGYAWPQVPSKEDMPGTRSLLGVGMLGPRSLPGVGMPDTPPERYIPEEVTP